MERVIYEMPLYTYSKSGELLGTYGSLQELAEHLGVEKRSVYKVLGGHLKNLKGLLIRANNQKELVPNTVYITDSYYNKNLKK